MRVSMPDYFRKQNLRDLLARVTRTDRMKPISIASMPDEGR